MNEVLSELVVVFTKVFEWFFHPRKTLCAPEYLLSRSDFPIGVYFGDRDMLGSEGAEMVVKSNAFFATGESQLFRIRGGSHGGWILGSRPHEIVSLLTCFFYGTVRYVFEPKPLYWWPGDGDIPREIP